MSEDLLKDRPTLFEGALVAHSIMNKYPNIQMISSEWKNHNPGSEATSGFLMGVLLNDALIKMDTNTTLIENDYQHHALLVQGRLALIDIMTQKEDRVRAWYRRNEINGYLRQNLSLSAYTTLENCLLDTFTKHTGAGNKKTIRL